ncbi:hypothetical protein CSKR_110303 [Clonorchis sinensis]|uniref:Uncharacterized protein n=2 Tax=Clonorchis sinensis TaxID=79923 RepID=G7Y764_CLOSI|nr:hypothetical protein CSKR_110303 [Clonorchis sinensis]GAA48799.1 hypothetical protein CLF_102051 [Clonorchis sinensis]
MEVSLRETLKQYNIANLKELMACDLENLLLKEIEKFSGSTGYLTLCKKLCQILMENLRREVDSRFFGPHHPLHFDTVLHPQPIAPWTKLLAGNLSVSRSPAAGVASYVFPSRADLLAAEAREGVVALLTKYPMFRGKLPSYFFNQSLQGPHFRRQIWRLILANERVRLLYVDLLRNDVDKTKSTRDEALSRICQEFIDSEPTMASLQGSTGCLYAMKCVLSFFHIACNAAEDVSIAHVRMAAAFVLAMRDFLPRTQPPELEDITVLIEEFFSLLSQMPSYLTHQPATWFRKFRPHPKHLHHNSNMATVAEVDWKVGRKMFGVLLLQNLRKLDAKMASDVVNEIVAVRGIVLVEDIGRQDHLCSEVVYELVQPLVESLFSGFLDPDVLLFVWDQIMLCLVGSAPVEQSLTQVLCSVMSILFYLAWLRAPNEGVFRLVPQATHRTIWTSTEPVPDCRFLDEENLTGTDDLPTKSFIRRVREVGRKLHVDDIKFMVKRHFFTEVFSHLSGFARDASGFHADSQATWSEWIGMLDKPERSLLEHREDQRLLRFKELERVKQTESDLRKTMESLKLCQQQLKEARDDAEEARRQARKSKLRQEQLEEESQAWEAIVQSLEKKLANANSQLQSYVEAARSTKLATFSCFEDKKDPTDC